MADAPAGEIFCSLVIPCYNEAGNLPALLTGFGAAAGNDFELIIVDNGSTDATAAVLAALAPKYPFARVVTVPVNKGYGHGITAGLRACRGLYAGWAHGDLQYGPAEIMRAAGLLRAEGGGKVFLKGLRTGRSPGELFFTAGMSVFESLLFLAPLWDINAQPTFFHRSLLDSWQGAPDDFLLDLFAFALARKKKFPVRRVRLALLARVGGCSSWNFGLASRLALSGRNLLRSFGVRRGLAGA